MASGDSLQLKPDVHGSRFLNQLNYPETIQVASGGRLISNGLKVPFPPRQPLSAFAQRPFCTTIFDFDFFTQ